MAISKELKDEFIKEAAQEIYKELNELSSKDNKKVTFDDIENGVISFRNKITHEITNEMLQEKIENFIEEKKTVRAAKANLKKKGSKKK